MVGQLDNNGILQALASNKQQLNSFGVKEIGLFGSYARNEQSNESDIDLLVDIQPEKKTFQNFMKLAYYLEGLLGRKVELVTKQSLSPYIGPHILNTVQYAAITD
jgi:predicted nucleotidyltransferase